MKRTDVHADPEDLALMKDAARRRGIPEADLIREGTHLAAMANRVWDQPLDWPTFDGTGEPVTKDEIRSEVSRRAGG